MANIQGYVEVQFGFAEGQNESKIIDRIRVKITLNCCTLQETNGPEISCIWIGHDLNDELRNK